MLRFRDMKILRYSHLSSQLEGPATLTTVCRVGQSLVVDIIGTHWQHSWESLGALPAASSPTSPSTELSSSPMRTATSSSSPRRCSWITRSRAERSVLAGSSGSGWTAEAAAADLPAASRVIFGGGRGGLPEFVARREIQNCPSPSSHCVRGKATGPATASSARASCRRRRRQALAALTALVSSLDRSWRHLSPVGGGGGGAEDLAGHRFARICGPKKPMDG